MAIDSSHEVRGLGLEIFGGVRMDRLAGIVNRVARGFSRISIRSQVDFAEFLGRGNSALVYGKKKGSAYDGIIMAESQSSQKFRFPYLTCKIPYNVPIPRHHYR